MAISIEYLERKEKIFIRSSEALARREAFIQYIREKEELLVIILGLVDVKEGAKADVSTELAWEKVAEQVEISKEPSMPERSSARFSGYGEMSRTTTTGRASMSLSMHLEGSKEERIPMRLMESVDARDYHERGVLNWAMILVMKDEPSRPRQYCLQFEKRELRDLWASCLQSHLRQPFTAVAGDDPRFLRKPGQSAGAVLNSMVPTPSKPPAVETAVPQPVQNRTSKRGSVADAVSIFESPVRLKSITRIVLQNPEAGALVAMSMHFDDDDHAVTFDVRERHTSAEDCKRLVLEFVNKHGVLKAETPSLYRYVRSVVQRALMERETEAVVNEITAEHLDHLIAKPQASPSNGTIKGVSAVSSDLDSVDRILHESRERLTKINRELEQRIGNHGPGAALVVRVLRRSAEKMKLINEVAAKVYIQKLHKHERFAENDAAALRMTAQTLDDETAGGQVTVPERQKVIL